MPIFAKNPVEKLRHAQRLEYNFLLKRRLVIGVNIKSVAQITSFHMSGQRALNSIPTRRYGLYKNALFLKKDPKNQKLIIFIQDPILKASFGQNFPDLLDILRKTSFVFTNMPEFLDIPRPMSSKLVHVGGIAMSKAKPLTTVRFFSQL